MAEIIKKTGGKPEGAESREALKEQLDALKTLRDELRVQAHLGNLEAREAWGRVEPSFDAMIRDAQKLGHVTVGAVEQLLQGFKKFVTAVKSERELRESRPHA